MKQYIVCVILMYILICPDYTLALMAPSGVDAQGNPVYDEQVENIVIDNTQRSVRLPPALSNYRMKRDDTNMPEDIQGLGEVRSNTGTGNKTNNTNNNQDLPDDMKYLEPDSNKHSSTGSTAGTTPVTVSGNNSVSTAGVNKSNTNDNTFALLWFIMACLIVTLVIVVLYILHTKKGNSSAENF